MKRIVVTVNDDTSQEDIDNLTEFIAVDLEMLELVGVVVYEEVDE